MKPLISIIVPIYNSQKYLEECIKSILNQSLQNFELILVNDGSTDSTVDICRKYCKCDKRVKLLSKENEGVSSARNLGLKQAKGKYIMFVDSDDWITSDMLNILYNNLVSNNCDLSVCGEFTKDDYDNIIKKNIGKDKIINIESNDNKKGLYDLLNTASLYGPCRKLYLREIILNNNILFNTNLKISEDVVFNFDYLKHVKTIAVINKACYFYRENKKSLSRSKIPQSCYENYFYVSNKVISFLKEKQLFLDDIERLITTHVVEGYLIYINDLILSNNYDKSIRRNLFHKLNNYKEIDKLLYNYISNKKLNKVYAFVIKSKNIFIWKIYLRLNIMKNKIVHIGR